MHPSADSYHGAEAVTLLLVSLPSRQLAVSAGAKVLFVVLLKPESVPSAFKVSALTCVALPQLSSTVVVRLCCRAVNTFAVLSQSQALFADLAT